MIFRGKTTIIQIVHLCGGNVIMHSIHRTQPPEEERVEKINHNFFSGSDLI